MKILVSYIIITMLIVSCVATKPLSPSECSKFSKGRYSFKKIKFHHWGSYNEVMNRIDSIETIITSGHRSDTTIYKISWIGNCLYERSFIKSTDRFSDSLIPLIKKKPIQFRITTYTDKYYIEQWVNDKKRRDTIWIQ